MSGKYGAIERHVHRKVNEQRHRHGKENLQGHPQLIDAAQSHARDMARRDFYSHKNPDGETPHDRITGDRVSENIVKIWDNGRTPKTIAGKAVRSWMNSAGHRRNLLSSTYCLSGVGVWKRGQWVLIVQVFAKSVPNDNPSLLGKLISMF